MERTFIFLEVVTLFDSMVGMKHVFIVNPIAGRKNCTDEICQMRNLLLANELDVTINVTQKPGDCETIARDYAETAERLKRPTRIYACGGDGTLNGAVNGIMQAGNSDFVSVTHVAKGSGNDFVKYFRYPERFSNVLNFANVRTEKIDVMRVNNRFCIDICSAGLDARVGTSVGKYRKFLSGNAAYNFSALVNVFKGISKPCVITIDGHNPVDMMATMICICNGSWYGGSYNPVPEADIQDGLLDVLVVDEVNILQAASMIKKYQTGRYKECKVVHHYKAKTIRISTPDIEPINLDGELLESGETSIEVLPKAINFFAPTEAWR